MARVKVVINRVKCNVTEDHTGADEVYLIAAAARDPNDIANAEKAKIGRLPGLTKIPNPSGGPATLKAPTKEMNNGDVWDPDATVVDMPLGDGPLYVGVWLMDQDAAEDIEEDEIKKMQEAVEAAGTALAPATNGSSALGGIIASTLIGFITQLVMFDDDDLLGFTDPLFHHHVILNPVAGSVPVGWPISGNVFPQYFKANLDGADYDVFYTVHIEP